MTNVSRGGIRDAARVIGATYVVNMAGLAVGAVTGVIVARTLGPSGKGIVVAAQTVTLGTVTILGLSIEHGIVFYAARLGLGVKSSLQRLSRIVAVIAFCVVAILVLVVKPLLPGPMLPYLIASCGVPFSLVALYYRSFLQGLQRIRDWNTLKAGPVFLGLVGLICLEVSGKLSVNAVTGVFAVASLLTALLATRMIVRLGPELRASPPQRVSRRIIKFGATAHVANLQSILSQRLDLLLMSFLSSAAQLGIYSVAVSISAPLSLGAISVADWIFPRSARQHLSKQSLSKIVSLVVLGYTVVAGALWVLVPELLRIFLGPRFLGAAGAARVLLIAMLPLSVTVVLNGWLKGRGEPGRVIYSEVVGSIVTILTLPSFIRRWQGLGAAWASLLAYGATCLVVCIVVATTKEATTLDQPIIPASPL